MSKPAGIGRAASSGTARASQPKFFLPFYEALMHQETLPDELVPFDLGYRCVRLLDGTYDFNPGHS